MTALGGVNGTVCNAQQYDQSQAFRHNTTYGGPSISCLTHGESIGLALTAEASLISSISVIFIFSWICWNIRCYRKTFPKADWRLFHGPVDVYMFSLFIFDIVQATGGILNIRWAHNGIVTTGHYCTAQGIVEQIGDLGVALITLLLAVHTFVAAVLPVGLKARGVALGLVCLACVFITLWVAIGAGTNKNYEIPTPYWCWINPQFSGDRLGGEYIWMWIALSTSAILYISLYFWAEGFWSVDEHYKFHWWNPDQRVGYTERRATLGMLLYPLAYSLIVLPISITRWLHHASSAATLFANSMFYLSGAINVLLFLIIKQGVLLPRPPRPEEIRVAESEMEPASQGTGPATISATARFQHSPEPTSGTLEDGGPRDIATPSHVNSRRISDVSI